MREGRGFMSPHTKDAQEVLVGPAVDRLMGGAPGVTSYQVGGSRRRSRLGDW